tara:strand:- start:1019 stop:1231 length:213 start_codon:yes stop_codon:yes gene_type:complete
MDKGRLGSRYASSGGVWHEGIGRALGMQKGKGRTAREERRALERLARKVISKKTSEMDAAIMAGKIRNEY